MLREFTGFFSPIFFAVGSGSDSPSDSACSSTASVQSSFFLICGGGIQSVMDMSLHVYVPLAPRKNPNPNLGKSIPGLLFLVQQQRGNLQLVSALRARWQKEGCLHMFEFFLGVGFRARLSQVGRPRHPPIPIFFSLILLFFSFFSFSRERRMKRIYKRIYKRRV